MALSDVTVRTAKPRERAYKLADSGGLYLYVSPTGGRLWRMKYRWNGTERKLSFGPYPVVSLQEARNARDGARKLMSAGTDPAAVKRREKAAGKLSAGNTFDAVANEYVAKAAQEGRSEATIAKLRWLHERLKPTLGRLPIDQIEPHELLVVLRDQEKKGLLETARRTRSFASRVFRYAVATARAKTDPAALLAGAIAAPRVTHLSAILEPKRAGELLRAIDRYSGEPLTRLAMQLAAQVFVRPGELRKAEWSEIDLTIGIWRIPANRMKKRREHVVPLSLQSVQIFSLARTISGKGRFVFPALGRPDRCLSENTINAALRRMGFATDEMSAHGFRAMASTLLNESGKWSPDAIERSLSHQDGDKVRAAYHRGAHWQERVQMSQWWSDHLDILRNGATIIAIATTK